MTAALIKKIQSNVFKSTSYMSSYLNRQTDRIQKMEKKPTQNKTKNSTRAPTKRYFKDCLCSTENRMHTLQDLNRELFKE